MSVGYASPYAPRDSQITQRRGRRVVIILLILLFILRVDLCEDGVAGWVGGVARWALL